MHPIFKKMPEQWGFRGDPFLWRELAQYFSGKNLPHEEKEFRNVLADAVTELTGYRLDDGRNFYVARYDLGTGMSAGGVSCRFWLETAIPLLWRRQDKKC